jgi:hypothetical protein
MATVYQAIHQTVFEQAQIDYQIPPCVEPITKIFGHAHRFYRVFKYDRLLQHANQQGRGHPAVYGAALHLVGDFTTWGAYALKVALIAKCAEDLLHQYQNLHLSFCRLKSTIDQRFPHSPPDLFKSSIPQKNVYLSPAFQLQISSQVILLKYRLLNIFNACLEVLIETFKLSMCMQDTYLLTQGNPQAQYEACTELVGDWDRYFSQLQNDTLYLKEQIFKKKELTNRILTKLETDRNAEKILRHLDLMNPQSPPSSTPSTWNTVAEAIGRTTDAILPAGRVSAIHIDLGEGQDFVPALPPARYPPWGGQIIHHPTPSARRSLVEQPVVRDHVANLGNAIFHDMANLVANIWPGF